MDIWSLLLANGDGPPTGYRSCIEVHGRPILPPLMSEERRQEMRQFQQAALRREAQRRNRDDNSSHTSFESATSGISSATFVIENSQSFAAVHNNSFLSEGEVFDFDEDGGDDLDLDEASNLMSKNFPTSRLEDPEVPGDTNLPSQIMVHDDHGHTGENELCKDDCMSTVSACTNTTSAAPSSVFDSIHLSKLKTKTQGNNSPSKFTNKVPGDSLLKGVVFMGPLRRPKTIIKTPSECYDPKMKPMFDRVSACVKGYLVRRLLKTEKVTFLLQTIQGIVELMFNLYADGSQESGSDVPCILAADVDLHGRLVKQLDGACQAVRDIFFTLSTAERMAIISTDRLKQATKAQKDSTTKIPSAKKSSSKVTNDRMVSRDKRGLFRALHKDKGRIKRSGVLPAARPVTK